jgi:hypothetical protein
MLRWLLFAAFAPVLSACATPNAQEGLTGGFAVKELGQDVYRVSFQGNGFTSRETVQTYWLYRCAELALEKGFTGFEILSDVQFVMRSPPASEDDPARTRSRVVSAPIPVGMGASRQELADAAAWRSGVQDALAERFDERVKVAHGGAVFIYDGGGGAPKPGIEADVHMIKKPVESMPPKLFNAATLHAALEPIIKAEKCDFGNVCPHVHEYLLPKGKLR